MLAAEELPAVLELARPVPNLSAPQQPAALPEQQQAVLPRTKPTSPDKNPSELTLPSKFLFLWTMMTNSFSRTSPSSQYPTLKELQFSMLF